MALAFSDEVMHAMGFRQFVAGETVVATFCSVIVYEARGIKILAGSTQVAAGVVANISYKLAVSVSVNDACRALINDEFADSEDDWKKETKSNGPFVLVLFGPTEEHTSAGSYLKDEVDGSITTYDSFPDVRVALAKIEANALPALLSALTCTFSEESRCVVFRKISRALAGNTSEGVIVHDLFFVGEGEILVSYNLSVDTVAAKLEATTRLAPVLSAKTARFFALGLGEDDQLKKFLYFFLALEVETHTVFGRINHADNLKALLSSPATQRGSIFRVLQEQTSQLRNLYDRFVWCAACRWTQLTDDDVMQFKALKKARDDIVHGGASEPPPGFAKLAEMLAWKILRLTNDDT